MNCVPDVVWAAIAVSSLTLLGVWLQNKGESKRLEKQLKHEAQQRKRERDLQLRRDLFLEAADSALKAQQALFDIANTNKPTELGVSTNRMNLGGLSKAHLVGSLDMIRAFDSMSNVFRDQMFQLIEIRLELEKARFDLDILNRSAAQLESYRNQFLAGVRELSAKTALSPEQVNSYLNPITDAQVQLERITEQRTQVQRRFEDLQRSLMVKGVGAVLEYGTVLARAYTIIRRELEQVEDFDVSAYEQFMAETSERTLAMGREFVDRMYKRFGSS